MKAYQAALRWHVDEGAGEALSDMPLDRTKVEDLRAEKTEEPKQTLSSPPASGSPAPQPSHSLQGSNEARVSAEQSAAAANTPEELQEAIAAFEGLSVKNTATNIVFSDGNPKAKVMLIGEAPGADEDKQGKPFVGASGRLLDKILACIGISRQSNEPDQSIYISNILNWRPPGNRTPTPQEIEISLAFVQRHIALIKPEILIFAGGVAAKSLLCSAESISRLRGKFHAYGPDSIPAIATYHPAYLLRTPLQKKAVWADMLLLQEKRRDMGFLKGE